MTCCFDKRPDAQAAASPTNLISRELLPLSSCAFNHPETFQLHTFLFPSRYVRQSKKSSTNQNLCIFGSRLKTLCISVEFGPLVAHCELESQRTCLEDSLSRSYHFSDKFRDQCNGGSDKDLIFIDDNSDETIPLISTSDSRSDSHCTSLNRKAYEQNSFTHYWYSHINATWICYKSPVCLIKVVTHQSAALNIDTRTILVAAAKY